jgi:putative oxidoreductase
MPAPVDSPAGSMDTVDKGVGRLSWPRTVLATDNSFAGLVLRIMLGVVMFPHGAQKVFGWFGGHGFSATMNSFTENMGIPWMFALLAVLAESAGSVALIVGLLTRVAALGIGVVMTVAILMVHWQNGFFMNWFGAKGGEGFEFHLLALGMAVALIIRGGGLWSIDRALAGKPTQPSA